MSVAGTGRFALVLSSFVVLAGCEEGAKLPFLEKPLFGGKKAAAGAQSEASAHLPVSALTVEKDVEAPEVFGKTDSGLWDGRPSLGGVWVAHPDVKEPERALIRNLDNGKEIIGALFRRERANPGPRFQVSSDAAAELGMLAGAPSQLEVVALRKEQVPVRPAPGAQPAPPEGPVILKRPGDEAAGAEGAADQPAKAGSGGQKPVDQVAEMAASAIEQATSASSAAEGAAAKPAPEAKPAPGNRPAASGLEKPYIQIGIFSVKANADNTANLLRNSGVVPTIRKFQSKGKTYWRVIVGPIASKADRKLLLQKVAGLGFPDAYPVTN